MSGTTGKTLRAAVIGAGWYGTHNHIPVLAGRPGVVLDGVSRLGAEELERVRSHFGFAFASEDYRDVLARRPDVVVVSSPHHLHHAHAAAAIDAGAHVLCEKPMTLDPAQAWDLVDRARARGVHLLLVNGYQYLPHLPALRTMIRDGIIGPVEHAMVSFISATRDVFHGDRGLNAWNTTFFRPDRATWQDPAKGGGFAYGQMSHAVPLLCWLTGLVPETVSGHAFGREAVDLAVSGSIAFRGGAVGSLSGAAAMPQGNRGLMRIFLAGREGMLTAEFDRDHCEIRRDDGEVRRIEVQDGAWIYNGRGPVEALIDLARGGPPELNRSPGEVGATTVGVIAALLASARAGGAPQPVGRAEVAP
jgi:predicted dehydrogenase